MHRFQVGHLVYSGSCRRRTGPSGLQVRIEDPYLGTPLISTAGYQVHGRCSRLQSSRALAPFVNAGSLLSSHTTLCTDRGRRSCRYFPSAMECSKVRSFCKGSPGLKDLSASASTSGCLRVGRRPRAAELLHTLRPLSGRAGPGPAFGRSMISVALFERAAAVPHRKLGSVFMRIVVKFAGRRAMHRMTPAFFLARTAPIGEGANVRISRAQRR